MLKCILLFPLLISSFAWGSDLSISFGPTIDGTIGTQKVFMLGYEMQDGPLSLLLESGGWNEPGGFAIFGGANAGLHIVAPSGMAMRAGFGPSLISQTDDRLSSLFEFHIQMKIGLEHDGYGVGLQGDHFSNAGIVLPNLGRDIVSLYIQFPM